jgi:hypothetical protein
MKSACVCSGRWARTYGCNFTKKYFRYPGFLVLKHTVRLSLQDEQVHVIDFILMHDSKNIHIGSLVEYLGFVVVADRRLDKKNFC